MQRRVGRQLTDDEARVLQRQPPGAQLLGGEQPGEAGAPAGGGELDGELSGACTRLGDFRFTSLSVAARIYAEKC